MRIRLTAAPDLQLFNFRSGFTPLSPFLQSGAQSWKFLPAGKIRRAKIAAGRGQALSPWPQALEIMAHQHKPLWGGGWHGFCNSQDKAKKNWDLPVDIGRGKA